VSFSTTGPLCLRSWTFSLTDPVSVILIDGSVDAPDTLGRMLGAERFQQLRESRGLEHDGLILPEKVAETYFHLAGQHRSTWTHEIDLSAFSDRPWWNH
jgi:hypothetical protein